MNGKQHGGWFPLPAAAIAGLLLAAAPAGAQSVRVWPSAVVSSDAVLLADIAELHGFDPAQAAHLAKAFVSTAPRAGGELLVHAGDIRAALVDAGANLSGLNVLGASRCRVARPRPIPAAAPASTRRPRPLLARRSAHPAAARPAGRTLEAIVREFIEARLPETGGRIEIRFSPASRGDLQLTDDGYRFQVRAEGPVKPGLVTLEVAATGAGQERRTLPLVAEVAVVREVVVARRVINRGETITGRHLKLEERRFTDGTAVGLTDLTAALGQQARQMVRAGDMLKPADVESRPLIRRGDAVTLWLKRGGLVIKTGGRARQDGRLGDRIDVARDGSRRKQDLIEATVTGPGTVTCGEDARLASTEDGR
jgi:flagella basal body P-ring formation protein FlgA